MIDELQQSLALAELDDDMRAEITEFTNLLCANLDKISGEYSTIKIGLMENHRLYAKATAKPGRDAIC